jgi:hypothetical protein
VLPSNSGNTPVRSTWTVVPAGADPVIFECVPASMAFSKAIRNAVRLPPPNSVSEVGVPPHSAAASVVSARAFCSSRP